jgi:DMSO/TMAO reductase YedYZ molybdopterin-dependent catalytic subunit
LKVEEGSITLRHATWAFLIPSLIAGQPSSRAGDDRPAAASDILLQVVGDVPSPLKLSAAEFAKLPRQTVRAKDHAGNEADFEGVALVEVLKRAGVKFGADLRGPALAQYLVVEASDGYRAIFALPELDPASTDRVVLLADHRDGKALLSTEGPLRVVVPGEKRHSRWVRQVKSLKVGHVP